MADLNNSKQLLLTLQTVAFLSLGQSAYASETSFDCRKANKSDEIAICQDSELGRLELKAGEHYNILKQRISQSDLKNISVPLLRNRQSCEYDTACIKKALIKSIQTYNYYIVRLEAMRVASNSRNIPATANSVNSQGPKTWANGNGVHFYGQNSTSSLYVGARGATYYSQSGPGYSYHSYTEPVHVSVGGEGLWRR